MVGLLLDRSNENPRINLRNEFITAENITKLFQKYNVPKEFDLLSVHIDLNDFYVWEAISSKYNPGDLAPFFKAKVTLSSKKTY